MIRRPLRPLARILRARADGADPALIEAQNRAERMAEVQTRARRRADGRLKLMAIAFVMVFSAVGVKMASFAAASPEEPRVARGATPILSIRADIVDRQGRILATNLLTHSLYVHPQQLIDPENAAAGLTKIFPDLKYEKLVKLFRSERKFDWIKRKISPEQMQAVHDLGEPGLLFGPREMRLYPNGQLAGHILGSTGYLDEGVRSAEIIGRAGVEKYFDAELRDPARAEKPLQLSLDLTLQTAMEEMLHNGMKVMSAKGASAVLMEVKSGEVLAMSSLPDFDPNNPPRAKAGQAADSPLFNRAVQGQYELGSTFKIFPVAQAMDLRLVNPSNWINTHTPMKIGKYNIHDFHSYGESLSVTDIIVKSSNVGTVRIAQMVGIERQKDFLEQLGFFEPTGLEISEAASGRPIVPKRWPAVTAATISFGHGLAASPLHLASAYATLANGGRRVRPTLVRQEYPLVGEAVLAPDAARRAVDMLREVVVRGTATGANVEGYRVAGKTGTADKPRPGGGYYSNRVVATFASIFPADDPRYVLVVSLDEPTVTRAGGGESRTAGATAVPVAAELIHRLGPLLDVPGTSVAKLPKIAPRREKAVALASNRSGG